MGRSVDFYFDLSSPYSYLAATQLDGIAARTGATVWWRPVVLAAVFKAADNTMPAHSPPKARYMFADLQRWAERYQVPFQFTSRFPVNAMKAHRLVIAAEQTQGAPEAARLAKRLFDALWVDDRDLGDPAELTRLADAIGLPGAALVAATDTQPVKDRLRANTDEAIARGMFGAPAFYLGRVSGGGPAPPELVAGGLEPSQGSKVDDELYWGNDRLEFLEAALTRPA